VRILEMTKKERIIAVLNKKDTCGQPYNFNITQKMKDKIGVQYNIDSSSVENFIGNHFLYLSFDPPEGFIPEKVGKNIEKDEFGVLWDIQDNYDIGEWGMVGHPVKDLDFDGYAFPSYKGKSRFRTAEKTISENPDRFNLLRMPGLFDVGWRITGMEDLMVAMASEPELTEKILDKALEFNIGIIEQIPEDIEGVRFLEDWGQQKGLMMGSKIWRRYLKPRLKEMYSACKSRGFTVFAHTCGDIIELFPDLIEIGVEVIDPIQPEVMDINLIKKEYGKDLVLFGGLGCQSTIPLGTVKQVMEEAEERVTILGEGGNYILGPSGSIPVEAPIENVVALIEFCKKLV
jgi:uroporphyrinogen decarboxylase